MKIYVSHASAFDYEAELYQPIKDSVLYAQHEIFLPHEPENITVKTQDIIGTFDLMIAEVSYPSTGQGIELGLAAATHVPIICFYKEGAKPSSSLRFYADNTMMYLTAQDLMQKMAEAIQQKTS